MSKRFKAAVSIGAFALSAACSVDPLLHGKQDPLADQPDSIRAAAPPVAPKPTDPRDEILPIAVVAPDFLTFKEGVVGEASIAARAYDRATLVDLRIENLGDFPGASYDAATGKLRWTPPVGFATSYTRQAKLTAIATTRAAPFISTQRSLNVFVQRAEGDPEVTNVTGLAGNPMREGEAREFVATVRDPNSLDQNGARPALMVGSAGGGGKDAASFVAVKPSTAQETNPVRDRSDPTLWRFRLIADLGRAELTSSQTRANFTLIALSRFGHASAPRVAELDVRTSVRQPTLGWAGRVRFAAGVENRWSAMVYDAAGEGRISARFSSACDGLAGATCACAPAVVAGGDNPGGSLCTVAWRIPADYKDGPQSLRIEGVNASPIAGDGTQARLSWPIDIDVEAAPPPVPPPAPPACPQPAPAPPVTQPPPKPPTPQPAPAPPPRPGRR